MRTGRGERVIIKLRSRRTVGFFFSCTAFSAHRGRRRPCNGPRVTDSFRQYCRSLHAVDAFRAGAVCSGARARIRGITRGDTANSREDRDGLERVLANEKGLSRGHGRARAHTHTTDDIAWSVRADSAAVTRDRWPPFRVTFIIVMIIVVVVVPFYKYTFL